MQSPYQGREPEDRVAPIASPLRQGSYRGLAATANHFVRESHMDEMARRHRTGPAGSCACTICRTSQGASGASTWPRPIRLEANRRKKPGHGFGLAAGSEKGGYVASCAEVATGERESVSGGHRVRMRCHRKSRSPEEPGGGVWAVRGSAGRCSSRSSLQRLHQRTPGSQLPRTAVCRHAGDRERVARSSGHAVRGGGGAPIVGWRRRWATRSSRRPASARAPCRSCRRDCPRLLDLQRRMRSTVTPLRLHNRPLDPTSRRLHMCALGPLLAAVVGVASPAWAQGSPDPPCVSGD